MQFQITSIQFDFEDDDFELSPAEQSEFYDDYVGTFWEADDEDDLIEELTSSAGFCIQSIDYRIILDDIDVPECEAPFDIDYTTQS